MNASQFETIPPRPNLDLFIQDQNPEKYQDLSVDNKKIVDLVKEFVRFGHELTDLDPKRLEILHRISAKVLVQHPNVRQEAKMDQLFGEGKELLLHPPKSFEAIHSPGDKLAAILCLASIPSQDRSESVEKRIAKYFLQEQRTPSDFFSLLSVLPKELMDGLFLNILCPLAKAYSPPKSLQGADPEELAEGLKVMSDKMPDLVRLVDPEQFEEAAKILKGRKPLDTFESIALLFTERGTRDNCLKRLNSTKNPSEIVREFQTKYKKIISHPELLSHNITLRRDNLEEICSDSKEVMVFGWHFCRYEDIANSLSGAINSPVHRAFNWQIGGVEDWETVTVEGRNIDKIISGRSEEEGSIRNCKAALTNIVLENYKRMQEGLPLIRVIFSVANNSPLSFSPEMIASKASGANACHTHAELRRAYKLCCEMKNTQLMEAAKQTFVFVMLKNESPDSEVTLLEKVTPFWEQPEWSAAWQERKNAVAEMDQLDKSEVKKNYWVTQLEAKVAAYDKT